MAHSLGALLPLTAIARLEDLAGRPETFPGALLLAGANLETLDAQARRLAAILLCRGDDPDRRCDGCRRAAAGMHPDLARIEPQGVQIRIDSIREAIAFGAGKPYEAGRRVAVISRAEQLGLEAANALLKTLEEPGRHFHWLLTTTRPEMLPPTVRSRCVAISIPRASRAERTAAWASRGWTDEDASELAGVDDARPAEGAAFLDKYRSWRAAVLASLQAGILQRRPGPLLVLAEQLAREEPWCSRVFSELLADAAVAAVGSGELIKHRAVAGGILDIGRSVSPEALRNAALKSADVPPDIRRGNKRLHYESVLLGLLGF